MNGLYVYGALLMAMCFTVGTMQGNTLVIALALVSASLAALAEAGAEILTVYDDFDGYAPAVAVVALGSWVATAVAAVTTLVALL